MDLLIKHRHIFFSFLISFSYCFPATNYTHIRRSKIISNAYRLPSYYSYATIRPSTYHSWMGVRNTKIKIETSKQHFVFPGNNIPTKSPTSTSIFISTRFKVIKPSPPCAKGSTFCEKVHDYPGSYLENLFRSVASDFHVLLGTDELNSTPIEQRVDGNPGNDNSLCPSVFEWVEMDQYWVDRFGICLQVLWKVLILQLADDVNREQIVYPKTAKNKDGKWLYVVNQAEYIQGVRIEKCLKSSDSENQSCFFSESFPMGYKTICKQKYIYRKMVAIDEEGKAATDTFQLPSCCSCFVIREGTDSRHTGMLRSAFISDTTSVPE